VRSVLVRRAIGVGLGFIAGFATMWVVSISQRANGSALPAAGREQTRQVAPNGSATAFVWLPDISGSVMVSQPYQVWIECHRPSKKQLILEADKTDSVWLDWRGPGLLEICYSDAQITKFNNRFVAAEQGLPEVREVEIVLKKVKKQSDCNDFTLQ
jgi:hypothetical protein